MAVCLGQPGGQWYKKNVKTTILLPYVQNHRVGAAARSCGSHRTTSQRQACLMVFFFIEYPY